MSGAASTPPRLSDGQRRHLTASLDLVEATLDELARLVGGSGGDSPRLLRRQVDDLSPALPSRGQEPIAQARAVLAELVRALGLEPRPYSSRQALQALVLSSLVILEDCFAATLRAYGETDPGLPSVLDPALRRLHDALTAIGAALD